MRYIRYWLEVLEPLKIVDCDTSRSGEITTLNHIPGSTTRGVVINRMVSNKDFEIKKKLLLSDKVHFLNAYPYIDEKCLIPAPMGFSENKKQDGTLRNTIGNSEFNEGEKRAALGEFGIIDGNTFRYMSLSKGDSLNIELNNNDIFRYDYINPPCEFAGFVAVQDDYYEECKDLLLESLKGAARIGGKKSSGYGKVILTCEELRHKPYTDYSISDTSELLRETEFYMMCLSPMAMLDEYGENCGIDLKMLAEQLGVSEVTIPNCATNIINKTGMNRVWGSRTPEYKMYAQGSVFKIACTQIPEVNNLRRIEDNGIGICKNEGCGRVIFLKNFDEIKSKKPLVSINKNIRKLNFSVKEEDYQKLIRLSAKGMLNAQLTRSKERYLSNVKNNLNITPSQSGIIVSMCRSMRYEEDPEKVNGMFSEYYKQVTAKSENQKVHISGGSVKDHSEIQAAKEILDTPIRELFPDIKETYCGIELKDLLTQSEEIKIRLDLILAKISAENRIGQGGY